MEIREALDELWEFHSPEPEPAWWWWAVTVTISLSLGVLVASSIQLQLDVWGPLSVALQLTGLLTSMHGLQRFFRWLHWRSAETKANREK